MPNKSWSEAVADAVRRYVGTTGSPIFTRQSLIDAELDAIVADTGSLGSTPHMTLSRELQQLRDGGLLEFLDDRGTYRLNASALEPAKPGTNKGVFIVGSHSIYEDEPERFYRFPPRYLTNASKLVGNWIIYQEPRRAGRRGYYATAKVERVVPDPQDDGMFLALIASGTYLEFGRDVPFRVDGEVVERGLVDADGRVNNGRAVWSVRTISDLDFNRIIDLGLIDADEQLPRVGLAEAAPQVVQEQHDPWKGPVDRVTQLVSRMVRDRQFRVRVLRAYDSRCALTGMKLVNGGGRVETEAAHIMAVGVGGPDVVTNGIALSGTIHWMFDRGLVSLSDAGEILLSRKINDVDGIRKLIHSDGHARLPAAPHLRPHSRYLEWHRRVCFDQAA